MIKREIPQDEWNKYITVFNKENNGKIVKVEVTDDEDYRIDYAESLPFKEIIITRQADNASVTITAGASNSFTHTIDKTVRLLINEDHNTPKILSIESILGRKAVIRFHPLANEDELK